MNHFHPSIKLTESQNKSKIFRLRETNTDVIKMFTEKLDPKKASKKFDMNTNILRNSAFFSSTSVMLSINVSNPAKFKNDLKEAHVAAVHKKK